MRGTPIIIWLTTSGVGVRMAATMKLMRMAYLRLRFKKATSIRPVLARKTMKIGISKITPKASSSRVARLKYSLTAGNEVRNSLL